MNNEKLPQIEGFKYSRYKNTSDISWRNFMVQKFNKMRHKKDKPE